MITIPSVLCSLVIAAAPVKFELQNDGNQPSMLFQLILTASLLAVGLYSIALRRKIAVLGNLAALVTIVGMIFVWHPALATAFAGRLGIGRGADLIFYCWVVISMLMILNLHLKMRIQSEMVTELIRKLAIAQPFAVPDQNNVAAARAVVSKDADRAKE